jgi:hypothetical protein
MNLRTNRPRPERLRKVWCCIGFCLALAMTSKAGTQYLVDFGEGRIQSVVPSEPYLCVVGSPALRYREPIRIAEPAEPNPAPKAPEPARLSVKPAAADHPPAPDLTPKAQAAVVTEVHSTSSQATPDSALPSIIPDDMRPRVRTEEFLPFFQLPGATAPTPPPPESPDAVPPSSATYRLK